MLINMLFMLDNSGVSPLLIFLPLNSLDSPAGVTKLSTSLSVNRVANPEANLVLQLSNPQ